MIRTIDRALSAVERPAAFLAALILFAVMGIVALDVAMRYLLNRPFLWSHDLVSLYLLPALFYLSLSKTQEIHGHIGVDILQYYLSDRSRHACQLLIGLLSAVLFGLIAYLGCLRAMDEYEDATVTSGLIEWPTWLSVAVVPLGAGLITLRLMLHALRHAIALGGARDGAIALPPLAGAEQSLLEGET